MRRTRNRICKILNFGNKMLTHDDFCKYILENKNWKDKIFFVFV